MRGVRSNSRPVPQEDLGPTTLNKCHQESETRPTGFTLDVCVLEKPEP